MVPENDHDLYYRGIDMRHVGLICLCLLLASCSGENYGGYPPYPVTGKVIVNGEPAKGVDVVFHHIGDWGGRSIVPKAVTDDEGNFTLSTYKLNDGAPAGDYMVSLQWPAYRLKKQGPDKLCGVFAKPESSGLKVTINAKKNDLTPFDLKAKVIDAKPKG